MNSGMKLNLIIFFIIFSQYNSMNIFEFISNKFIECGKFIVKTLKPLQLKIKRTLFPEIHYNNVNKELKQNIIVSAPDLAILHGKKMESHTVLTKDDIFITLHRLPSMNRSKTNNVVLLHHGLLGSSADWILLGPEKSLPYLLLHAGYDVWLINARGNYYSRDHIAIEKDVNYWNFTWQEMGIYDLPALIDYIIKVTNTKNKLIYIGHSMGATVFVTMLSFFPKYNEKFKIAILLAPLIFMAKTKGPLDIISAEAFDPSMVLLSIIGIGEFFPKRRIPQWLAEQYCVGPVTYCTNPLLFLTGSVNQICNWNQNLTLGILNNVPAGGSTKTIMHYAQMVKSQKFHLFGNKKKEISLENITVPIILISSTDDIVSTTYDVTKLYFHLSCAIDHYIINHKNVTHMDFAWSPNADILIFAKILKYIQGSTHCYKP